MGAVVVVVVVVVLRRSKTLILFYSPKVPSQAFMNMLHKEERKIDIFIH